MLITYNREKLLNAIVYFSANTSLCGIVKLFKLLYFLDFEHYKQTGRSVTGLDYYAWKMGPVPVDLYEEMPVPEPDLAEKVRINPIQTRFENPLFQIEPKAEFDSSHFTRRELTILKDLADRYEMSKADEMIEATHVETLPWHRVYNVEHQQRGKIPYEYALSEDEADLIRDLEQEHREIVEAYDESGNDTSRSAVHIR
ncbi:MAG TPA: Panacea domain-containing protein [Pyrinomonadaceae bacterium]|nr:Panacea domain-containing protein [Pyrinomonadaceae bacterium]